MESNKEDFGINSKTEEEKMEENLYPSEIRMPKLNLNYHDQKKYKETWYKWITKRKKK